MIVTTLLVYWWCIAPPLLEYANLQKTLNIRLWPISWSSNKIHIGYGCAMCTKDIGMMVTSSWPSWPKSGQPKLDALYLSKTNSSCCSLSFLFEKDLSSSCIKVYGTPCCSRNSSQVNISSIGIVWVDNLKFSNSLDNMLNLVSSCKHKHQQTLVVCIIR